VTDAQLAGTAIPAGAAVQLCLGAANRDPAVFDAPHGLNLGRGANPHLSFGAGPHGCPGAALAKAVLRAVVCRLLEAGPESGDGEVRFLQTVEALAPASLPIRLRRLDRA
jgi:cytochrome P450